MKYAYDIVNIVYLLNNYYFREMMLKIEEKCMVILKMNNKIKCRLY
jgi:hypothetical protein